MGRNRVRDPAVQSFGRVGARMKGMVGPGPVAWAPRRLSHGARGPGSGDPVAANP